MIFVYACIGSLIIFLCGFFAGMLFSRARVELAREELVAQILQFAKECEKRGLHVGVDTIFGCGSPTGGAVRENRE